MTDKLSYKGTGVDWRRGEARAAPAGSPELCEPGEATPGEIVFLFAEHGCGRLRGGAARGRPADVPSGRRGYFAQQQVLDVLAYLRLLHNRYDDEALAAVLASPLVGVSNDALVLLGAPDGGRSSPASSGSRRISSAGRAALPRLPPTV